MRESIDSDRFIPYLSLHEFETLVFAAALADEDLLGEPAVTQRLRSETAAVGDDVELLNDSPATAPSKRIQAAWPEYIKEVDGVDAISWVGLDAIRSRSPAFDQWIDAMVAFGDH